MVRGAGRRREGLPTKVAGINMFFAAKINAAFMLSPNRILAQQLGGETVSLRGNVLEAYGISEAVLVVVGGGCASDNQCVLRGRQQPVVQTTSLPPSSAQTTCKEVAEIDLAPLMPTEKPPVTVLWQHHDEAHLRQQFRADESLAPFNIL
jgi:hypothetical protein